MDALEDPKDRALIKYYLLQYEQVVEPRRYALRKCLIHNDANDWNVLTQKGKVSGIIDFGDMCYSWLINELAVALPYVLAEKEDPLGVAGIVIGAYHREFPLKREEIEILYYLVAGRICMSLCNSARAAKLRPESDYIRISESPMKQLLHKWISISPEEAANCFLKAAGFDTPEFDEAEEYLRRRNEVMPRSLSLSYTHPIVMKRAAFQYMFNNRGNRFLDAYNNIMLVGHCHPKVVEATPGVLHRINTNTRYLYSEILNYSERLLAYFPPKIKPRFPGEFRQCGYRPGPETEQGIYGQRQNIGVEKWISRKYPGRDCCKPLQTQKREFLSRYPVVSDAKGLWEWPPR